jgi:hypothetical protein
VTVSGPSFIQALLRLRSVRELGIKLPSAMHISAIRVAALARFAGAAKASAVLRLPHLRRLATLVAFVHCLESTAIDDALEVLEGLLHDLFGDAIKADKKARLRTLKDLDLAAATLASACQMYSSREVGAMPIPAPACSTAPNGRPTGRSSAGHWVCRRNPSLHWPPYPLNWIAPIVR